MNCVNINIIGLCYNNEACIKIYNECNRLVANKKTCNGKVCVCLKKWCKYKLVIKYNGMCITKYLFVTNYNNYPIYLRYELIYHLILIFLLPAAYRRAAAASMPPCR